MTYKIIFDIASNIKTNYRVKNKYAKIKYTKESLRVLLFLKKYGYICNYKLNYIQKNIFIGLKYINNRPLILDFIKAKKQFKGKHFNQKMLKKLSKKHPYFIVSTEKGLMYLKEVILTKIKTKKIIGEFKI